MRRLSLLVHWWCDCERWEWCKEAWRSCDGCNSAWCICEILSLFIGSLYYERSRTPCAALVWLELRFCFRPARIFYLNSISLASNCCRYCYCYCFVFVSYCHTNCWIVWFLILLPFRNMCVFFFTTTPSVTRQYVECASSWNWRTRIVYVVMRHVAMWLLEIFDI